MPASAFFQHVHHRLKGEKKKKGVQKLLNVDLLLVLNPLQSNMLQQGKTFFLIPKGNQARPWINVLQYYVFQILIGSYIYALRNTSSPSSLLESLSNFFKALKARFQL